MSVHINIKQHLKSHFLGENFPISGRMVAKDLGCTVQNVNWAIRQMNHMLSGRKTREKGETFWHMLEQHRPEMEVFSEAIAKKRAKTKLSKDALELIFSVISEAPEPLTKAEIAVKAGMSPRSVSRAIMFMNEFKSMKMKKRIYVADWTVADGAHKRVQYPMYAAGDKKDEPRVQFDYHKPRVEKPVVVVPEDYIDKCVDDPLRMKAKRLVTEFVPRPDIAASWMMSHDH